MNGSGEWTTEQLSAIRVDDSFRVAPYREDGSTPGTPVWVWVVVTGDAAFVRTARAGSRWFAAAIRERAGEASFGEWAGPVRFRHVEEERRRDEVDAAFRAKYGSDPHYSADVLTRSRERILEIRPAG